MVLETRRQVADVALELGYRCGCLGQRGENDRADDSGRPSEATTALSPLDCASIPALFRCIILYYIQMIYSPLDEGDNAVSAWEHFADHRTEHGCLTRCRAAHWEWPSPPSAPSAVAGYRPRSGAASASMPRCAPASTPLGICGSPRCPPSRGAAASLCRSSLLRPPWLAKVCGRARCTGVGVSPAR